MDRSGLISGAALALIFLYLGAANADAKSNKVRGYISGIEAEDVFFVEDIRIVLDKDIFAEFAAAGETHTYEYTLADLRVGTFVEVRGNRIFASESILAESIIIYAEDYKKIKRTALIEREPHLEKIGNTWSGDFFADGQRIRVMPSTKVLYQPNKSERKAQREIERLNKSRERAVQKGKSPSMELDSDEPNVELLQSLDQIGPNMFMTYEGIRSEDGSIMAESLTFKRNELTWNEARWKKMLTPRIKEPVYEDNKPGRITVPWAGSFRLVPSREAQEYIQRLGNSLIPRYQKDMPDDHPDKIQFHFYLVKALAPNAFALPNGIIVVMAPLLKVLENEAQLAFVLSHEIAHSVQEHYRQQKEHKKTERTILKLGSIAAAAMGVPIASDALSYAEGAISAGYSRHHENQADRLGLNGLVRLGYDPREAPQVWKVLVSKIR